MFPIVKDHYLNDNKNIDNHLPVFIPKSHCAFIKAYWSIINTICIFFCSLCRYIFIWWSQGGSNS